MAASGPSSPTKELPDELALRLAHAVIASPVACGKCGYNLQGLPGNGACPECGLDVGKSVQAIVDPEASRLPRLTDPRGVGNGLFWFMACALLATVLLLLQAVLWRLDTVRAWSLAGMLMPRDLTLLCAIITLAASWSVWRLKPPPGQDTGGSVWRDIILLALGMTCFGVCCAALWSRQRKIGPPPRQSLRLDDFETLFLVLSCGAGIVALVGIQGVLRTIGVRSRAYRISTAARQSVQGMITAVGGIAVGLTVRWLLDRFGGAPWLVQIASIVVWMSALMTMIGMAYMTANAWWVRADLRSPPPALSQIVLPTLPEDTRVPHEGDEDDEGDAGEEGAEEEGTEVRRREGTDGE